MPLFYHRQLLQGDRNMAKPMISMITGQLLHFIYLKVSSLIRIDPVSNTMVADKAFYESTDNTFGRRIINPYPECLFNVKENCHLFFFFLWWKLLDTIDMPQGIWLITPGDGAISAAWCWFLFLADLKVNTSHSQTDLGQWKSMLLSLCITFISVTWPLWSLAHWTMIGVVRGKGRQPSTEWVIFSTWLLKSSLRSPFHEHPNRTQISSCSTPTNHIFLPQTSLPPVF